MLASLLTVKDRGPISLLSLEGCSVLVWLLLCAGIKGRLGFLGANKSTDAD